MNVFHIQDNEYIRHPQIFSYLLLLLNTLDYWVFSRIYHTGIVNVYSLLCGFFHSTQLFEIYSKSKLNWYLYSLDGQYKNFRTLWLHHSLLISMVLLLCFWILLIFKDSSLIYIVSVQLDLFTIFFALYSFFYFTPSILGSFSFCINVQHLNFLYSWSTVG